LPKRNKERKGQANPNAPLDLPGPRTSYLTVRHIITSCSYLLR
jgi:hypothetical protein